MSNNYLYKTIFSTLFWLIVFSAQAQEGSYLVSGKITDSNGEPIPLARIHCTTNDKQSVSDNFGNYTIQLPVKTKVDLVFSCVGFKDTQKRLQTKGKGSKQVLNIVLYWDKQTLGTVVVEDQEVRKTTLTRIDPHTVRSIPTVSGGIESLIKTMPGVASNNELSSQYSVRGGSFDENLVYINGIEVYRPVLMRSAQQEGLSIVNPQLVSSILFSSGGFESKYGDKMSSVLDIRYRQPTKFAGSAELSMLGGAFHLEDISRNKKWSYLLGVRHKNTQYLLNSLETKGEYKPSFTDIQALLNYKTNDKLSFSFLGNIARNVYNFTPKDRETSFGHVKEAYRFKVYFDGQEQDRFDTWFGAVSSTYKPQKNATLKLIASAFNSKERENYDIQGQYWLGKVNTSLGSENFGEITEAKGIGSYLNHARNRLDAKVYSIEHQGSIEKDFTQHDWGLRLQYQSFTDRLREWRMLDSADYILPGNNDMPGLNITPLILKDTVFANHQLHSYRTEAYWQSSREFYHPTNKMSVTLGGRLNYWDYNKQFLFSPRASFSIKPEWQSDILFRIATGLYMQPPFYKEMRRPNGSLNPNIKAQSSLHIVAGSDYNLVIWSRPFKFTTEVYYKHMQNLIPFMVENVKVVYQGENQSNGYAAGADFKINGEFVEGVESWLSVSIMQTNEILRDYFLSQQTGTAEKEVSVPRPTDQRVRVNLFFQDYLPMLPSFKMNMNLAFGTGIPVFFPNANHHTVVKRTPPFRRVDIGFAYEVIGPRQQKLKKGILKHFTQMDVYFEVLNLLDISNVISYLWVKDNQNMVYLIPNTLTPRQFNVKVAVKF